MRKQRISSLALCLLCSLSVHAKAETPEAKTTGAETEISEVATTPILVKEYQTGFVLAENAYKTRCELFADRTLITREAGGLKSVETRRTTLSGYQKALAGARKGKVSVSAGPVDIPTVSYYGNLRVQNGEGTLSTVRVSLFEENGLEGTKTVNSAFEARLLRNFLDSHCP